MPFVSSHPAVTRRPAAGRRLEPLLEGFRQSGGLVAGDAVAAMLRPHCDQPLSTLARSILRRELVHVCWHTQVLVPLFQFDGREMSLRHGVRQVIEALAPAYDDWDIAAWFAEPSPWLNGQRPADVVGRDPAAVLEAARVDGVLTG
jgi:hypothetical protein